MSVVAQVTFSTDFFQAVAGEELQTNQGCLGKSLALWLAEQLQQRHMPVLEVSPEDFGWILILSRQPTLYWIGCANLDHQISGWTIFVVVERSMLQRLMRRAMPIEELQHLTAQLQENVTQIPNVSDIRWE